MDPSLAQTAASADEDEWDTDGFVIPSLEIEDPDQNTADIPKVENPKPTEVETPKEEHIYLGPHGAPPCQVKQQEQKSSSRKQKFKHRLKEADRVYSGTGREDKVDSLRELVGGTKMSGTASKSSPKDWLDPHCHESEFDRRPLR